MEQYESLKAKLKKLLTLSVRGEAGEADNARMILKKLCRQYGISINDLLDDVVRQVIELANIYSIDLFKFIDLKMRYNELRPYRNGKKY